MKLLFIHGAPATGKLTMALALRKIIGATVFDNHAAIDTARGTLPFGTSEFWKLVHATRLSSLQMAAKQGVPIVIMTSCYSDPDDLPVFKSYEVVVKTNCAEVLPVFLHCSQSEAIRRVGNADRVERGKIRTASGLKKFGRQYNLSPVPRKNCLMIDSEAQTADKTALEIAAHFHLL